MWHIIKYKDRNNIVTVKSSINPSGIRSGHSFNILEETSSGPLVFFGFIFFLSFLIPLAVYDVIASIFAFVEPSSILMGETLSSVEKNTAWWSSILASFCCLSIQYRCHQEVGILQRHH